MSPVHLLLLFSLLVSSILSTTSVNFKCTTPTTCQAMIGYVAPKATNPSLLKDRFEVDSLSSLLTSNNWTTSDTNRSIPAYSTVRIPFTCTCTNRTGLGVSEGKPVYTVVKDDTLADIAQTIFGGFVTFWDIAAYNGISNVSLIDIEQKLWIPLPCSCDAVDGTTVIHLAHVVASGSSLSQIAAEFGTTEAVLLNLNSETLKDAKDLQAGQILDVPIGGDGKSHVLVAGDDKSRSTMLRGDNMVGEKRRRGATPRSSTSTTTRRGGRGSTTFDATISSPSTGDFELRGRDPPRVDQPQPQADHPSSSTTPSLAPEDHPSSSTTPSRAPEDQGGAEERGAPRRRGRGPCTGRSFTPGARRVWHIRYNSMGKPIGEESTKLHRKIGDLVRDPSYCPLGRRWKDVPQSSLDDMWEEIQSEYDFGGHPRMREYCFSVAKDRYKDFKNYLKHDIWMKYKDSEEELKAHLDSRVVLEQFYALVAYWESPEGMAEAERLSKNRSKKVMKHHSGTMTFAQLGAKMVTDGAEPDPMDVFVKAYTPKDPAKDPETVRMLDQISVLRQSQGSMGSEGTSSMEPILTQVIGEGKGKYVRGHGKHHSRKEVATPEGRHMAQQMTRLVHENQHLHTVVDTLHASLAENTTAFSYVKDLLASICGQLNMPVPPMPSVGQNNTADEGRSVADEATGPGSSSGR